MTHTLAKSIFTDKELKYTYTAIKQRKSVIIDDVLSQQEFKTTNYLKNRLYRGPFLNDLNDAYYVQSTERIVTPRLKEDLFALYSIYNVIFNAHFGQCGHFSFNTLVDSIMFVSDEKLNSLFWTSLHEHHSKCHSAIKDYDSGAKIHIRQKGLCDGVLIERKQKDEIFLGYASADVNLTALADRVVSMPVCSGLNERYNVSELYHSHLNSMVDAMSQVNKTASDIVQKNRGFAFTSLYEKDGDQEVLVSGVSTSLSEGMSVISSGFIHVLNEILYNMIPTCMPNVCYGLDELKNVWISKNVFIDVISLGLTLAVSLHLDEQLYPVICNPKNTGHLYAFSRSPPFMAYIDLIFQLPCFSTSCLSLIFNGNTDVETALQNDLSFGDDHFNPAAVTQIDCAMYETEYDMLQLIHTLFECESIKKPIMMNYLKAMKTGKDVAKYKKAESKAVFTNADLDSAFNEFINKPTLFPLFMDHSQKLNCVCMRNFNRILFKMQALEKNDGYQGEPKIGFECTENEHGHCMLFDVTSLKISPCDGFSVCKIFTICGKLSFEVIEYELKIQDAKVRVFLVNGDGVSLINPFYTTESLLLVDMLNPSRNLNKAELANRLSKWSHIYIEQGSAGLDGILDYFDYRNHTYSLASCFYAYFINHDLNISFGSSFRLFRDQIYARTVSRVSRISKGESVTTKDKIEAHRNPRAIQKLNSCMASNCKCPLSTEYETYLRGIRNWNEYLKDFKKCQELLMRGVSLYIEASFYHLCSFKYVDTGVYSKFGIKRCSKCPREFKHGVNATLCEKSHGQTIPKGNFNYKRAQAINSQRKIRHAR